MKTLILNSLNALSRIQTSLQLANTHTKTKLHPPIKIFWIRSWLGYVCLRDILNRAVNSIIFAELELEK